jgi:hypothetical protein
MEYDKIKHNPFALKKGQMMWELYNRFDEPQFRSVPKGLTKEDANNMLRFLVLLCDRKSPFWEEANITKRQNKCLQALGLDKKSSVWDSLYTDKYKNWLGLSLRMYFSTFWDIEFALWFSYIIQIQSLIEKMREIKTYDDIAEEVKYQQALEKLIESINNLKTKIQTLEISMFKNVELADRMAESLPKDENGYFWAEKYAIRTVS